MMIKKQKKAIPWFLILIVICFVFGLNFWALEVEADQATSSATVTNSLPTASSVSVNSGAASMTLTEATTTAVTVTFTVTDNNGCQDIDSHATNDTVAVFYRTNVSGGASCTPDNNNCYSLSCSQDGGSCTAGGSDLDATYTCTASIQFYADATDAGTYVATNWTATATPRDNAGTDGNTGADTIEMATTTALNVTATIAYGELALGANTGTGDQTTTVTNTGNDNPIDIQLDGYGSIDGDGKAIVCTIGSITVGYERYSLSASTDWSSKTQLTDTATTLSSFDLAKGVSSTKGVYWGLGMSSSGASGSCSGKVNFTAVSG